MSCEDRTDEQRQDPTGVVLAAILRVSQSRPKAVPR